MAMCPLTTSTTNSCEGVCYRVSGDVPAGSFGLFLCLRDLKAARPEKNSTAKVVAIAQTAAAMPMWTKLRLSRPNIGAMARGA